MQCELCKNNEATVHFKQAHDGKVKEMYLCEECAAKNGFNVHSPMSLTDFLFGMSEGSFGEVESEGSSGQEVEPGPDKACPNCHMRLSDFRKTSRLGCAVCYEVFSEELTPLLADVQKGSQHVGKMPVQRILRTSEKTSTGIASIQRDLDKAIASQNFEEAAILRDRIETIKQQLASAEPGSAIENQKSEIYHDT